tara:strand:- start:107 stop:466 length:360 start_codon:yes stop_codon:yes gene_type:complete
MNKTFSNYQSMLDYGSDLLKSSGISNHLKESEWLLLHVLDRDFSWLYTRLTDIPKNKDVDNYLHCIDLRMNHIPIQIIMGKATFYGRDFIIDDGVFIPRPETEIIIDNLKKKIFLQPLI